MQYTKTCILCDTKIRSAHRLCPEHFTQYRNQMNEPWFKALAEEQAKQDDIDRRERYLIPYSSATDLYGNYEQKGLLAKRDVGRPSTDWRIVHKVLEIYDQSVEDVLMKRTPRIISLRAISNQIDNKIDHCTVFKILKSYRRKV